MNMEFILATLMGIVGNLSDSGHEINMTQLNCVAQNVFFETRGEPIRDKIYVANVTMNRVNDERWPNTACEVVHQKYQFSWTHENHNFIETVNRNKIEKQAWKDSVEVAGLVMTGLINDYTNNAVWYHRNDVNPWWAKKYNKLTSIRSNTHLFYN